MIERSKEEQKNIFKEIKKGKRKEVEAETESKVKDIQNVKYDVKFYIFVKQIMELKNQIPNKFGKFVINKNNNIKL